MDRIFISHASEDGHWAEWVARLLQELGFEIELDLWNWRLGDDFIDRMNAALEWNEATVAIHSIEYFKKKYSKMEANAAQALIARTDKRLIPIRVDAEPLPPLWAPNIDLNLHRITEPEAIRKIVDGFRPFAPGRIDGLDYEQIADRLGVGFPGPSHPVLDSEINLAREISAVRRAIAGDLKSLQRAESSPALVEEVFTEAIELGRIYLHEPPIAVFNRARDLALSVQAELDRNRNPSQLRDFHAAKSRALGIISYTCLDLGLSQTSIEIARACLVHAQQSGDVNLEAWAYGTLALIARFEDRNKDSVDYALQGLTRDVVGPARCRLLSNAAESYSNLGQEDAVKSLLSESADHADVEPRAGYHGEGIFGFPRARVHYYAASAMLQLPAESSSARAAVEADLAIQLFEQGNADVRSYNDILVARVHLARACVQSHQLDRVEDAILPVVTAPTKFRTAWHAHFLKRLDVVLAEDPFRASHESRSIRPLIQEYLADPEVSILSA